jgi:hypothetical protein
MPSLTPTQIRDAAIRAVEAFINDKVPLNAGVAKEAQSMDMNSEQVKRLVETVNTITYLKLLGMAKDRTFEFGLANYPDIMKILAVPELNDISELPSEEETPVEGVEKVASDATPVLYDMPQHEKVLLMVKAAADNKVKLQQFKDDNERLRGDIEKSAANFRKDEKCLDKLASLAINDTEFQAVARLVTGNFQSRKEIPRGLFKYAELVEADNMVKLYKEAKQLVADTHKHVDMERRAANVQVALLKEALLDSAAAAATEAVTRTVLGAGKIIAKPFIAPVKGLGKAIANPFREGAGLKEYHRGSVSKAITRNAGKAVTPVMDASYYRMAGGPGVTASGKSKNVWDALQSN